MGIPSDQHASPDDAGREAVVVRAETPADVVAVRAVHTAAFDDPTTIPALVDALREVKGGERTVSLVACLGDTVVGHVMLSPCLLDAPRRLVEVLCLSPLGVRPEAQGRGAGSLLIAAALAEADARGIPLVFVEGDPAYYSRRGFERADEHGFRSPSLRIPPPAFQVAVLSGYEPWMTGTYVYSDVFWDLDCVGLRDPEA